MASTPEDPFPFAPYDLLERHTGAQTQILFHDFFYAMASMRSELLFLLFLLQIIVRTSPTFYFQGRKYTAVQHKSDTYALTPHASNCKRRTKEAMFKFYS